VDGYTVDTAELLLAADAIERSGSELIAGPALKYCTDPAAAGNAKLAEALSSFQDSSRQAVRTLATAVANAAVELRETVNEYRRIDRRNADLFALDEPDATGGVPGIIAAALSGRSPGE
jgi:hypothetical protein